MLFGMDLKTHIGSKVREARSASGMTQDQLAEVLGRSTRTISAIESGMSLTSLSTLEEIAEKLKKPLAFFFSAFGEGVPSKRQSKTEQSILALLSSSTERDLKLFLDLLRTLRAHNASPGPQSPTGGA